MKEAISLEQGVAHNSLKMDEQKQNHAENENGMPCEWQEAFMNDNLIRQIKGDKSLPCVGCNPQKTPCEAYKILTQYNNQQSNNTGEGSGQ